MRDHRAVLTKGQVLNHLKLHLDYKMIVNTNKLLAAEKTTH